MTGKARIGILGGGGIVGAHAAGYHANLDRAQVIAVAEPRPECADRLRELFGNDVRIEADYHDVIAADDIDAVDIVLPHDLHMPQPSPPRKPASPCWWRRSWPAMCTSATG